jgi:hypothetical protein
MTRGPARGDEGEMAALRFDGFRIATLVSKPIDNPMPSVTAIVSLQIDRLCQPPQIDAKDSVSSTLNPPNTGVFRPIQQGWISSAAPSSKWSAPLSY